MSKSIFLLFLAFNVFILIESKSFSEVSEIDPANDYEFLSEWNDCGRSNYINMTGMTRIVGGQNASIYQFPYMVSIQIGGRHICGGALISKDHVLTAAQCVFRQPFNDFVLRLGSSFNNTGGCLRDVKRVVINPNYNNVTKEDDIALLRIEPPVVLGPNFHNVIPICLPKSMPNIINRTSLLTGWGGPKNVSGPTVVARRMHSARLPIVTNSRCAKLYGNSTTVTTRDLCASYENGTVGPCFNDMGDPLAIRSSDGPSGRWFLVGVASRGLVCGDQRRTLGIFAKVREYYDWIREELAKSKPKTKLVIPTSTSTSHLK